MLWVLIRSASPGTSNEHHNICFRGEIRKILYGYPLLSVAMQHMFLLRNEENIKELS